MKTSRRTRANPGGEIAPEDVVGRDRLVDHLWRTLDRQSVVLSAERRMGKTCILKKMRAEKPAGSEAVYQDLEGLRSPPELAEKLLNDLRPLLGKTGRARHLYRDLVSELGGTEVAGLLKLPTGRNIPWKELLRTTLEGAAESQGRLVLLWDEVPLFVHAVMKDHGHREAMTLLDVLRALRQELSRVRMVFTGSLGLHAVVYELQREGYVNVPFNDMHLVDVPPLDLRDATELARRCLAGDGVDGRLADVVARVVAEEVEGHPYYIQHVIEALATRATVPTASLVRTIVTDSLTRPDDPWNMRHYVVRLDEYYPGDVGLVLAILDSTAETDMALSRDRVMNAVKGRIPTEDAEGVRRLTNRLMEDHYLARDAEGRVGFKSSLLRRWWRMERGLGE